MSRWGESRLPIVCYHELDRDRRRGKSGNARDPQKLSVGWNFNRCMAALIPQDHNKKLNENLTERFRSRRRNLSCVCVQSILYMSVLCVCVPVYLFMGFVSELYVSVWVCV